MTAPVIIVFFALFFSEVYLIIFYQLHLLLIKKNSVFKIELQLIRLNLNPYQALY